MKPGGPEKYDYEYARNGTANIFLAVEFKAGKRVTRVKKRRTMKDFALFVKILVDEEYPDIEALQLVTDNLNTHKEKSFSNALADGSVRWRHRSEKWRHGPGEGMTRKRRSTGNLRGRRLTRNCPSITFHN